MGKRLLILGIGNPLRCDDAIGLEIVKRLSDLHSDDIDVKETEEAGLALLDLMHGYEHVILVDAIRAPESEAGDILRFTTDQLEKKTGRHSTHMLSLPRLLATAERMELRMPKTIVIIAVKIAIADEFGEGLSPEIEAAIPKAVGLVKQETKMFLN